MSRPIFSGVKQFARSHRRLVTILVPTLLVLLVAGSYGLWSVLQWQSYERQTSQSFGSIHDELDEALKLEVKDDRSYSEKLTALSGIKTKVDRFEQDCQPASLLAWQVSFESTKKFKEKCDRATSSLEQLQKDLDKVVTYLRDEKQTADVIRRLGGTVEVDETKWQEMHNIWLQAGQKLDEAKVGDVSKPAYDALKERLLAVVTAWEELIAAHDAKDRIRFERATDELMKAYGSFKATTDDTSSIFLTLEDSLKKTYQATF